MTTRRARPMFTRHHDPAAFLAQAAPLFAADAAGTNLTEGLARALLDEGPARPPSDEQRERRPAGERPCGAGPPGPLFLGVGADGGRPTMTALQTVPRAMVLAEGATRASDRTVVEAVDALAGHAARTPRVVGPPPLCERFLPRWSDATGAVPALFQRHHLYRLESVTPGPDVPGVLQRAVAADGPLASVWAQRFLVDVGDAPEDAPAPDLTPLLARGRLHLWRAHDAPVAMAAWTRPTRGGCAIAYVYTPPEERGRGYATALVRELSRGLLEGALGLSPRTFVCLYANAAQPAPNRVYAAVGYRPVGASEVWRLDAP